jgi:NDP-sugar pyrophosphorylase family protein
MKAGIIAAGRGERLREGTNQLKPLVKLGDRTLIEHVLTSMATADVSEVVVIINEDSLAIRNHIGGSRWPFALRWIVETTPSSMHSFLRIVETLAANDEGPFLISTTDTVTDPKSYAAFASEARTLEHVDVALALTRPTNDDKPLFVRTDGSRITAIGQDAAPSDWATAGLYCVSPSILGEANTARRDRLDALRKFLERLLERDYALVGIPISKSIDVDHPADIEAAKQLLRTLKT